jgi:hypothetical protein
MLQYQRFALFRQLNAQLQAFARIERANLGLCLFNASSLRVTMPEGAVGAYPAQ